MKLPRLLLVVILILVVLGLGSCGVAALRMDEGLSPDAIPDLLQGLMPDPPAVDADDISTCRAAVSSGTIEFTGTCPISVEAASGSVRRLEIRNPGPADIEVRLRAPATAERELATGKTERIDIPPNERAEVDLLCTNVAGCRIRVG